MGTLYKQDLDRIQLDFIKEAAKLRGTDVLFYEVLSQIKDIYTDIEIESETQPIRVAVIMEQYPQNRKTLQREGWYNKDSEDNPITMYVPLDLETLKRWQYVMIPGRIKGDGNPSDYRLYEVTKISTNMDHPHYYLIAVAPIFTDNSPEIDRKQSTNFIDFNKIPEI